MESSIEHDQYQLSGYMHPLYAASQAEFGTFRELNECGGWILERPINGTPYCDAMGLYPLFICRDWSRLPLDLAQLDDRLVSLTFVTDPFGEFNVDKLRKHFDVCSHFKNHYVTNLTLPLNQIVSRHRWKDVRNSLNKVVVETCLDPFQYLDEWTEIYGSLINKHKIQGIRQFSKKAFELQLQIPGTVYFRALHGHQTVSALIFYIQNDVAYGHLMATNELGYSLGAAYAIMWCALEYFVGKVKWVLLGAGAGLDNTNNDGLSAFKRGWATGTRPVYFCGRILNRHQYSELAKTFGNPETSYFPVYRAGEFG